MMILSILATVVLLGALFYHRVSLFISSLILLAWTAALGVAGLWSAWVLVPLAIILVPFNLTPMRKSMISAPVFRGFRKVMPPMSRTEKEAIDAGTTWWEGDLFQGKPDWKKLHNYPQPRLTAEEQAFLDGPVEEACRMANDFQITHELADLPPELWAYLKEHRFFAMIIKKEYGGLEFSAYAQSRVLQKLSGVSGILAITVGVPNSLGPGELLQHYGTDEQKNHYLPRLARGQEIPCFALTSPEAGSDAGAIPDTGIVCMGEWQGQQVLGMSLTWNKRYITLAPIATVLGLAFKLSDPEKLLGGAEDLGITCALIPTTTPGVEIGRRHFPLNVPFQNGPTRGKDVFVPIDYIIGGPKMAGQGWRMLVECLSVGRGITLPSNSTGGVKSVALATGAYAHIRRQFKISIGKMEGIEEPLARIAGNAYVMDAAASLITYGIMLGEKPAVLSAIVKYHCTHRGQQSIIDAMDITGGKDLSMFEAQEASDVIKKAAGTNVDISFGMSLDESLGDEVRVTVIATGIDSEQTAKKAVDRHQNAQKQTTNNQDTQSQTDSVAKDPFDGWNDPNTGVDNDATTDNNEFSNVKKPEFNVFNDDSSTADDDNLSTPPFFKNRRS